MHLDVSELNKFYSDTVLGKFTKKRIQESVQKIWPSQFSGQVAGFGFCPPILSLFLGRSEQTICLMPGKQGATPWPTKKANCSVLVEETSWPIATSTIDRLVILHGLENSEKIKDLFQEIWRVLAPSAKVIFVVPNRSGWWARSEATPFGQGRPYSIGQLKKQLTLHGFKIEQYVTALHSPPIERLHLLKTAEFFEKLGGRFRSRLGAGIILLEASKQIYALRKPPISAKIIKPMDVIEEFVDPKPVLRGSKALF